MDHADEDYAQRTARIKDLLSSYYGSGDSAQGGSSAPGAPSTSTASVAPGGAPAPPGRLPAAMLDSPAYNADRYIAHVLKTYTLDKLLTEHRGMAREIKNLDSDMQQLVYENYNKFITATDTIRTMKANVDGMGAEMDKLKGIMDRVTDQSSGVNAKLQRRRDQVEELNSVQGLIKKLQAVFDLPKRMHAALEEDALDAAVSYYAEAQPLLKKYGHRSAFKSVQMEADAVAKELSRQLKKRLAERKDDTEQVVLLLRKLGEPDDTLQDRYLQGRAERLHRILAEAGAVADAMAAATKGLALPADALSGVESLEAWGFEDSQPPALGAFVRCLDERLINALQETVVNVASIFLANDPAPAKRKPLVGVAKEALAGYWQLVRRVVSDAGAAAAHRAACLTQASADMELDVQAASLNFSNDWGATAVAQALSAASTDIGLLHSALPELSVRDRASELVEKSVREHVIAAYGALESRIHTALGLVAGKLAASSSDNGGSAVEQAQLAVLAPGYAYVSEAVQRGLASLLAGLSAYQTQGRLMATWHDTFVDLVAGHLQGFLLGLGGHCMALAQVKDDSTSSQHRRGSGAGAAPNPAAAPPAAELPKPGMVLMLAKLCSLLEGQSVPYAMEALASNFPSTGRGRGPEDMPAFVAGEVARQLGTAANLLLNAYVDLHGSKLTQLVRRSVASTNWLQATEPQGPRPVCDLLAERLVKAEAEVVKLVESSGRSAGGLEAVKHGRAGSSVSTGDASLALESSNVERGVAKLFRERPKLLGNVKFTQAALLAAIAAVGLKSLEECVRLQTFGRAGLQQLQLDMHYVRPKLMRIVGAPANEAVAALVDDVVTAGVERCLEPQLLEAAALQRLMAAAAEH